MNKLMKIVVYILAVTGLACIVKHTRITYCKDGCCLCNSFKSKVEGSKTKVEGVKTKVEGVKTKVEGAKTKVHVFKAKVHGFKTKESETKEEFKAKEEGEKRTGTRYGSNPIQY